MTKYTEYFKEIWLPIYVKQYRDGSYKERKAIKEKIYKDTRLKEYEKNDIWTGIVRRG